MADHVETHWPHLAALVETLNQLDGSTIRVTRGDAVAIVEALTEHADRGGAVPWR